MQFAIRNPQSAFRSAAAWILAAALLYAPWDYGAVSEPAIVRLNWMLGAALVAFAASAAVKGCSLFFVGKRGRQIGSRSLGDLFTQ